MAIVINSNIASLSAQRNLAASQSNLQQSFNRLSSGYRINSAKDDAAGLAISESMKMTIRSLSVAERNSNDAVSMVQTAEAALGQVTDLLGRMREIATQGANGILTSTDRSYLSTEFRQLQLEITRIQSSAKFNGTRLIGAPVASGVQGLQAAATAASQALDAQLPNLQSAASQSLATVGTFFGTIGSPTAADQLVNDNQLAANNYVPFSAPGVSSLSGAQSALATANSVLSAYQSVESALNAAIPARAGWSAASADVQAGVAAAQAYRDAAQNALSAYQSLNAASSPTVVTFQVGIQNTSADRIQVSFGGINLSSVTAAGTTVAGATGDGSRVALDAIDAALATVSTARSRFGAVMNRMDTVVANTQTQRVNISAANSRIRDVDVAEETASLSRNQVLMQAGSSILAQANQSPQAALALLR